MMERLRKCRHPVEPTGDEQGRREVFQFSTANEYEYGIYTYSSLGFLHRPSPAFSLGFVAAHDASCMTKATRMPPTGRRPSTAAPRRSNPLRTRARRILTKILERAALKRDKNERMIRPPRPVSFDLEDLVAWLIAKSEGATGEVWRCAYCGLHLAIDDLELDHREPLSRGGTNDLSNLTVSCKPDNLQKGELTEAEYRLLREGVLSSFGTKAQQTIFTALRLAAMAKRLRFHPRTKKGTDDVNER